MASNPSAEEAEIGRSLELTGQLVWVNWLSPVSIRVFFSKKYTGKYLQKIPNIDFWAPGTCVVSRARM